MSKTVKVILIAIPSLFILGIGLLCARLAAPSWELENQLKTVISIHDTDRMKKLAMDDGTYQALTLLKKEYSVSANDFQGGGYVRGVIVGYYPAKVGDEPLNCYMVLQPMHWYTLVPRWTLTKVSVDPISIPDLKF